MGKILNIRELYLEFKEGDRIKLEDPNKKVQLLKYVNSELKRISELHINIVAHNKDMKDFKINQIDEYNHLIRVKQMIEGNLGRKKTEINPDLKLSDILIDGKTADQVKSYYQNPDGISKYLAMFLRALRYKGYFKKQSNSKKITDKQLEIIGKNEFMPDYIDRRDYNPSDLIIKRQFKNIPDL